MPSATIFEARRSEAAGSDRADAGAGREDLSGTCGTGDAGAEHRAAVTDPESFLAALAGEWRLEREIEDRRARERGRFSGVATFRWEGGRLCYDEAGELRLPGRAPLAGARRYFWSVEDGRMQVRFADGRPFHTFELAARPATRHDCPPDTYAGTYDFSAWPDWTVVWDVTGPRKAYRARSLYQRIEGPACAPSGFASRRGGN